MDPEHVPDLPDLSNNTNFNGFNDDHSGLIPEAELRQLSKDLHAFFTAIDSSPYGDGLGQAACTFAN